MGRINTKDELKDELGIHSVDELADQKNQRKLLDLLKENKISFELARELLSTVPELIKAFTTVISTMGEIGTSLSETKKHRWSTLTELATSGALKSNDIIEAMKIIQEIEEKEHIDFGAYINRAMNILGGLAGLLILAIVFGGKETPKS